MQVVRKSRNPTRKASVNQANSTGKGVRLGKTTTKSPPNQKNEKGSLTKSRVEEGKEDQKGNDTKGKNNSNKGKALDDNGNTTSETSKPRTAQVWRVVEPNPNKAHQDDGSQSSVQEVDHRTDKGKKELANTLKPINGPTHKTNDAMDSSPGLPSIFPSPPQLKANPLESISVRKHYSKRSMGTKSNPTNKKPDHLQVTKKDQGSPSAYRNGKRANEKKKAPIPQ
ncbi:unnamed protein product [Linum trigynum]|uniref:Uncharacterized protein n=1 Tax=Linum trigynum TaxID=586398 RepID=A0AAV2DSU3_9ROSI